MELNIKRDGLKDKDGLDNDLYIKYSKHLGNANRMIKKLKEKLYAEFNIHKGIRSLHPEALNKRNIVSIFDSMLTRTMQIPENTLSTDILIVQTYFFDVLENIIEDGFMYEDEKYICLTASAGQIRTKKTVFIKESVFKKHQRTLMCGLTLESINEQGGMNVNKFLAYNALNNSATDEWKGFDIRKSIVVDDMETMVRGNVDLIDDETYQITRMEMDVPITHTDGCGMVLPSLSKKSFMVRLPWVKGLLIPFPFDKFIRVANKDNDGNTYGEVTDIYGQKHDLLKEGIQVIFTKSQFKMYKFYKDWDHYIENFLKYNCQAGLCNEEEDRINDAKINYQMLQTLTDMTDDELEIISQKSKNNINNIGSNRDTMLRVLGVTKASTNKNYIQQGLDIYPELLCDTYSREILKQVKKSMVRSARAGKLDLNAKYTFISPDLYAFCEYLILGDPNPKGLLADKEVYCNLYKTEPKLDCLRSPHLFREHAVRENVAVGDKEIKKWFVTNSLYTSIHDLISKILQFDVDGDKALVVADHTLIEVAERNMEGIVPLYYNMRKAGAEILSNKSIYKGLINAYTGGNIGMYSNNISKIWNGPNVNLDIIKLLCMENNFVIDYAKTLYKPVRPEKLKKEINSHTQAKVPHFFIYAKDKEKDRVEKVNKSVVNRLEKIIPNPNIKFSATNLGKFNYKNLKDKKSVKCKGEEINEAIIKKYTELDLKSHFMVNGDSDDAGNIIFLYNDIKNQILEVHDDLRYVVNVLVDYLYVKKKSNYKTTLWECFGDIIVENLRSNVKENSILCEKCNTRFEASNNKAKYCDPCAKEIKLENDRRIQRERYNSRK